QFNEETKGKTAEQKWEYLNHLGGGEGGALVDVFEKTGPAEKKAGEITDDDRRTKIRKNFPEENRKYVADAFSDIVEREKMHNNPLDTEAADAHKKAERARKLVDGYKPGNARSELALVKGLGVTPTDEQVTAVEKSPRKGVGGALDTAGKVQKDVGTGAGILEAGPNMVTKGIEDGVKLAEAVTPGDDAFMNADRTQRSADQEKFNTNLKNARDRRKDPFVKGNEELTKEYGGKPAEGSPGATLAQGVAAGTAPQPGTMFAPKGTPQQGQPQESEDEKDAKKAQARFNEVYYKNRLGKI
ncbi:MAG: hypothetical protein HYU99_11590, partial [Deltaproteobacteria bacterium]|nr:hypothetical protein [Deltaproteobacteria bacterium]